MTVDEPTCTVRKMAVHVPISQVLLDEVDSDRIREGIKRDLEAAERDPDAFLLGIFAAADEEMGLAGWDWRSPRLNE